MCHSHAFSSCRKAIDLFRQQHGELTVPPGPNEEPKRTLIIEWDRPIDEGFVGVGQKVKLANGQRVWAQTAAVDGITRTLTRFEWNAQEGRWKVVQHFPLTKGWDNTTKSYDPKEEVTFVGIPVD